MPNENLAAMVAARNAAQAPAAPVPSVTPVPMAAPAMPNAYANPMAAPQYQQPQAPAQAQVQSAPVAGEVMSFDGFNPNEISDEPIAENFFFLPRVANSGVYELVIHKVAIGERSVQGEVRTYLDIQARATHIDDPQHSGRISFKVDLPVRGMQRPYDRYFYEFVYFTKSYTSGPNGQMIPQLATAVEKLPYTRNDGTDTETVVPAMAGAKMYAAFARRTGNSVNSFFMNIQGFFDYETRRSLAEITKNGPASALERAHIALRSEGYVLEVRQPRGGSMQSMPPMQGAPMVQGQGFNQYQHFVAPQYGQPTQYQGYQYPQAAQMQQVQQAPSQYSYQPRPQAPVNNYGGLPGYTAPNAAQPANVAAPTSVNPLSVQRQAQTPVAAPVTGQTPDDDDIAF